MIAIESFKKYKVRDFVTLLLFALLFFLGSYLIQASLNAYLIFRLEVKSIQLDIVLGTAFSAASIPLLTSFFISTTVASVMLPLLINMSLLSFFVGIIGAIVSFLIWYHVRTTRFALQNEYAV